MRHSYSVVREAARRNMRLIRTHFNVAVGINTAIIGGAVMGSLPPVACAELHYDTTIGILLDARSRPRHPSTCM